jgi:hypothetical protein
MAGIAMTASGGEAALDTLRMVTTHAHKHNYLTCH